MSTDTEQSLRRLLALAKVVDVDSMGLVHENGETCRACQYQEIATPAVVAALCEFRLMTMTPHTMAEMDAAIAALDAALRSGQ